MSDEQSNIPQEPKGDFLHDRVGPLVVVGTLIALALSYAIKLVRPDKVKEKPKPQIPDIQKVEFPEGENNPKPKSIEGLREVRVQTQKSRG